MRRCIADQSVRLHLICSADEIHKSSAYLTEAYLLSPSKHTREAREPTGAPFCFAFSTIDKKVGFFNWLEGEGSTVRKEKLKPAFNKLIGYVLLINLIRRSNHRA